MNKQTLKVIQSALQSDKGLFPLNSTWLALHQQYNIGRTQGTKLEITAQDKAELWVLVKQATGIDLEQTAVTEFANMQREHALAVALDEKLAGQAVKKNRLAVKALPGQSLKINGGDYPLPPYSHVDMALAEFSSTGHRCILAIENYRCFDRLENLHLDLPAHYADPLVLYRGDNSYSGQAVRQLLEKLGLPVLVMADMDPQGLLIAQSFAHVVGLVAPDLSELETLLADPRIANPSLYAKQLASCSASLDSSPYGLIRSIWQMLKTHQAGIVQEYWLQNAGNLMLHGLD